MKESNAIFKNESYLRIKPAETDPDISFFLVYSAEYAQLFANVFMDLIEVKKDKLVKVHTRPFLAEYKKAYILGRKYFKDTFAITSETLYGKYGGVLERTLHTHFYHSNFEILRNGWNYWSRYTEFTFEFETFRTYGYNCGIISALNEYRRLHPVMFSNFEKCDNPKEHILSKPNQVNIDIENLKRASLPNIFSKKMPISIPIDHFRVLFESKNKKGQPFVSQDDFVKFIRTAFLGQHQAEKLKLNAHFGEKAKVISLFHDFYTTGLDYEANSRFTDKYISLLTDNFQGWRFDQVKQNFKSQKSSL